MSSDKHGVAERIKPISLGDGVGIDAFELVHAGQRAHQHQQGALRKMEIRDERIHRFPLVTRSDENGCVAGCGLEPPSGLRDGFQHTSGRCSYSGDMRRCVEDFRCGVIHRIPFRMHDVVFESVGLDGGEGAESDVQGHFRDRMCFSQFRQL